MDKKRMRTLIILQAEAGVRVPVFFGDLILWVLVACRICFRLSLKSVLEMLRKKTDGYWLNT